jgi:hypothetical protein
MTTQGCVTSFGTHIVSSSPKNFAKSVQTAAGVNLNQLGSLESKDGQAYTFDFSKSGGGDIAGAKGTGSGKIVQSQPAPIASYDIDWLRISLDSGKLAQEAYQVYTSNGRPLTTGLACTNGEKDNTPYSAQMCTWSPWRDYGRSRNDRVLRLERQQLVVPHHICQPVQQAHQDNQGQETDGHPRQRRPVRRYGQGVQLDRGLHQEVPQGQE